MKLTRHNGRSGKNGTYNPRHNDRRFDVENSGHIDSERAKKNVYWDCYRGYTTAGSREDSSQPDFSFEQIELAYYTENYSDFIEAQNARNEKKTWGEPCGTRYERCCGVMTAAPAETCCVPIVRGRGKCDES